MRTYTLTTADAESWQALIPVDLSAPGSLEYARICEKQTRWPARLFVVEQQDKPLAAYTYLLRSMDGLPFAGNFRGFWDICTPEYRGPLWLNGGMPSDGPRFSDIFAQHCAEAGIVAEFAHLNPWSVPEQMLETDCIRPNRDIVYIDLNQSEEEVWSKSLCSDARRQTKQGKKAGVEVRRAESLKDVWAFFQLYTETMDRHNADERYYFSFEYFQSFFETMPANSFFVMAEYEGRMVAGGLYFHDCDDLYWHLSAADRKFAFVRPVNVYLYDTIVKALGRGFKRMILGGGYGAGDGVFRFKSQFSPLRAQFCTYRRVHDPGIYGALSAACIEQNPKVQASDFFPSYRAV